MTGPLQIGDATLYTGDALEVLRTLPEASVQMCVTSPAYFGLRSYLPPGHPDKKFEMGAERTPDEFVSRLVEVFREVRRVLHPTGTLWCNIGDSYATGAGRVGECPGGGERGARWRGEDTRGYRGERLANGRGDQPAILRQKTRGLRDGSRCGKHTAMAARGTGSLALCARSAGVRRASAHQPSRCRA